MSPGGVAGAGAGAREAGWGRCGAGWSRVAGAQVRWLRGPGWDGAGLINRFKVCGCQQATGGEYTIVRKN